MKVNTMRSIDRWAGIPVCFIISPFRWLSDVLRSAKKHTITLARDCRLSGVALYEAFAHGVLATGIHIIDLEITPTPCLYFSLHHIVDVDGGVIITGSHNPAEYNGFKLAIGKTTIHGETIQELKKIIESKNFIIGRGTLQSYDIITPYIDHLADDIKISNKNISFALDGGNGTGGPVAVQLFKKLGVPPRDELFIEMDGQFPNHHPDPTVPENLQDLITSVREKKLNVGIAFDGDADRIGAIDDKGNILWGDELMILFARDILQAKKQGTFISEVKSSQVMYDDIEKHGGKAIMWKTGHSLIKEKMQEVGALLAGEMSGHIFFADRYFGYDDAIYAAARLVEIISKNTVPLSELLRDLPKTFKTPEIRVDCPDTKKFSIVSKITEHYKKTHAVIDIDGARIQFQDGWGLVRASNTQPVLVLRFEAQSETTLKKIQTDIEGTLEKFLKD